MLLLSYDAATPDEVRSLCSLIRDGLGALRTPYRPAPEVFTRAASPGPRSPISASILDAEVDTARTISAITSDIAEAAQLDDRPAVLDEQLAWLGRVAPTAVAVMEPGDILDLRVLGDRLRRLAGLPDPDLEEQMRMATLRRKARLGSDFWGAATQVAALSRASGHAVSDRSVQRWSATGEVEARETETGSVEYRLSSVVEAVARRRKPAAA